MSNLVNSTSHRAHIAHTHTHTHYFSRVWLKTFFAQRTLPPFSHSQLFTSYNLAVTINHLIHGQRDFLVIWPSKVRLKVMSPTPSLRSIQEDKFLLRKQFQ